MTQEHSDPYKSPGPFSITHASGRHSCWLLMIFVCPHPTPTSAVAATESCFMAHPEGAGASLPCPLPEQPQCRGPRPLPPKPGRPCGESAELGRRVRALAGRASAPGCSKGRLPGGWPLLLQEPTASATAPPVVSSAAGRLMGRGQAHLESSSLQELVNTGLSVFTMHVMADTTPAASSFFTRARTKLGLSWGMRQLSRGTSADQAGERGTLLKTHVDGHDNKGKEEFPGGPVVKKPTADAGDTGSIPGLGRSHMLQETKPVCHKY